MGHRAGWRSRRTRLREPRTARATASSVMRSALANPLPMYTIVVGRTSSASWKRSRSPVTMSTGQCRALRQGGDDVVCLESLDADSGDPDGVQHGLDDGHLRRQGVGHLFGLRPLISGHAVRLVLGHEVDPPLRTPVGVEAGHQVGGGVVGQHAGDRVQESTHSTDGCAVGGRDRLRDTVEGTEVHRAESSSMSRGGVAMQTLAPGLSQYDRHDRALDDRSSEDRPYRWRRPMA